MVNDYYKTYFNNREEKITKSKRGLVIKQTKADSVSKVMDKNRKEYDKLRAEIIYLMEERTRRIEEKIDKQLMEHKRQMEKIIELLFGKAKSKMVRRKLNKKPEREEEFTIEDSDVYYRRQTTIARNKFKQCN